MMKSRNDRIVSRLLLVVALTLAGCGKLTHQTPPKGEVQDTVARVLPPFLSLDSMELEPIGAGTEAVKVNFKAIVLPKEDMYALDREVDGTPKVTLLKLVNSKGAKCSLYGFVLARRMVDKWTFEMPVIETGLGQFGTPRGAFGPQSYIAGSSDAIAALQEQETNAELQRQAKKAALEKEERERIARAERQAREEQALRELQERNRIAMEAAQKEAAARKRIEDERRRIEEKRERAKKNVEKLEESAARAEQWARETAQRQSNSLERDIARTARKDADEAKRVATEARREFESVWGAEKK